MFVFFMRAHAAAETNSGQGDRGKEGRKEGVTTLGRANGCSDVMLIAHSHL